MTNNVEEIIVETAGYSSTDKLRFTPGPAKCGGISDGVVFEHDNKGAWIVDYKDLVKMLELAKSVRGK